MFLFILDFGIKFKIQHINYATGIHRINNSFKIENKCLNGDGNVFYIYYIVNIYVEV